MSGGAKAGKWVEGRDRWLCECELPVNQAYNTRCPACGCVRPEVPAADPKARSPEPDDAFVAAVERKLGVGIGTLCDANPRAICRAVLEVASPPSLDVWLVLAQYDNEGSELEGVFASEREAEEFAAGCRESKRAPDSFRVEKWPVRQA